MVYNKSTDKEVQCVIFADIIVDISHENLDKTYQYTVPEEIEGQVVIGSLVSIPFGKGNNKRTGYVVGISQEANYPVERIKSVEGIVEGSLVIESQLIQLAFWMKDNYGATMNDALRTVIPIKKSVKNVEKRYIHLAVTQDQALDSLRLYQKKSYKARIRLLEALMENTTLSYEIVTGQLNISKSTIKDMEKQGILECSSQVVYRNPIKELSMEQTRIALNPEQQRIATSILNEFNRGERSTYLIHGITGSGKTEVYMEIIEGVLAQGKQVIMLIPEIALTYQTVNRFYRRFGNRVSIMNSRLSAGERYDQCTRAKEGSIDVIIGPRSALFTPFQNLGLILIDEEHEGSYKSENPPKYHAREVAIERARLAGAAVVLGSATPSLEAYYHAKIGEYKLYTIDKRAGEGTLPTVYVEDLREELKAKNRSIFSRHLKALILDRLEKKEQIMLFINRRGYAGFVSCRACGYVMGCPHCDVSLTSHNNGRLLCHYCGYEVQTPKHCLKCGSPYIAAFGIGTQKVEEFVKKEFPMAKVLRMDTDTTMGKEGHQRILSAFANHEADILVGTQMIVKGHDFKNVTLVGIMAADLSLYASDYRASERTYQLLAQAAGRAGRGDKPGEVVIQTYNPKHYSIECAKQNDYEGFYEQEMMFRNLLGYPPAANIMAILITSKKEELAKQASQMIATAVTEGFVKSEIEESLKVIGPTRGILSKVNDIYRFVIHIKAKDYGTLKEIKNFMEGFVDYSSIFSNCSVQYDFNPMSGY